MEHWTVEVKKLQDDIAILKAENEYLRAILDDMWKGYRMVETAASRAHVKHKEELTKIDKV